MESLYLIGERPAYSPQIGHLIAMMDYARHTTLETVQGLSMKELDCVYDEESNSIGALLMHFAAVEYLYQVHTFEERPLNEEETARWGHALDLGEAGRTRIKGHELDYYVSLLNEVRNKTYELFQAKTDDWLYEQRDFWYNRQANFYFMWFHVFEDEINHRGQIRWLKRRVREKLSKS
ncbi:DinB family protein [Paenibacillus sp. CCS19]|uniref:DinB family protein n=1 Tax=Paenibacillus sp. CCS19 TaxID=3158387 RepID=UPI00295F4587|nr:DinB family protein [Paenibacillus cellulosilyticus]